MNANHNLHWQYAQFLKDLIRFFRFFPVKSYSQLAKLVEKVHLFVNAFPIVIEDGDIVDNDKRISECLMDAYYYLHRENPDQYPANHLTEHAYIIIQDHASEIPRQAREIVSNPLFLLYLRESALAENVVSQSTSASGLWRSQPRAIHSESSFIEHEEPMNKFEKPKR